LINEQLIYSIYQDVRKEFAYPPTSITLTHEPSPDGCPFYIQDMTVYLDVNQIRDVEHCKSIIRHELGHPHFAPISVEIDSKIALETAKTYHLDPNTVNMICNISYDIIVDYTLKLNLNDNIEHRTRLAVQSESYQDQIKRSYWLQYLTVFYASLSGSSRMFGQFSSDVRQRVARALKVCRSYEPLEDKIFRLNDIIVEWFRSQDNSSNDSESNFSKSLEEANNLIKPSPCHPHTKEELRGEIKDAISNLAGSVSLSDKIGKNVVSNIGLKAGVILEDIDFYRSHARKNIRFSIKPTKMSGLCRHAGHVLWSSYDSIDSLDIERSISMSGINIPDVTTLKELRVPGGYINHHDHSVSIVIVLDTSGSMVRNDALVTCFSFIAAGEFYRFNTGALLFSDDPYLFIPCTINYRRTEEMIYKNYRSGGTTLLPALKKANDFGRGNVIFVISDFLAESGIEEINQSLAVLAEWNIVQPIVLFQRGLTPTAVPAITISNPDELNGILIDQIQNHFKP